MGNATAADVLAGTARWSAEASDCLTWLASLPDDSVDLLFTSPPYEAARTYSIGFNLRGQAWVDWMVEVVKAAVPKVKGLIAVVCEGQTRDYRYSAVPFLLMADLHRAGFCLRKPVAFRRVGIPGSGGPDWLRNDWEPVVCVTRPGKLPWSDNTACGHPPKWAPGGEMSHRVSDGTRVNQWGKTVGDGQPTAKARKADGTRDERKRPSHRVITRDRPGQRKPGPNGNSYDPPALANPGNAIQQTYKADEIAALLAEAGDVKHCNVGGGQMGHELAHMNEAPFPLELAEFFVLSFCPPGGVVGDCFLGSGTTLHAAVEHGRRGVGCDIRETQSGLARKRMATVTPTLYGGADGPHPGGSG